MVTNSPMTSPAVLRFSAAVALLARLVLSGVPIAHYLRSQRRGITVKPGSGTRAQRMLVTAQAALATLLLVSATLLVATVANLRNGEVAGPHGREIDLAIAACTISWDASLWTLNERDFEDVPGLKLMRAVAS